MTAQAYPLQWPPGWPRTKRRRKSDFLVTPDKSRKLLLREMQQAGASHIVISSNVQLREDGQPYASELRKQHADPGVAVYFVMDKRPMVMARDAYLQPHENIRALGLTFAALRAIERHGGRHMMEQAFSGFTALPAPGAARPKRQWWDILQVRPDASRDVIEANFKALAKVRHPDAGGSAEAMAELNAARKEALKS